jgi:predicted amidohydrolase YtcJ
MAVPDLLLLNGRIMAPDGNSRQPTAVLVRDCRIAAVGTDESVRALAGRDTESIDLAGRRVLPGFTDAHFHFYDWSLRRRGLQLADVSSLVALQSRLAAAAAAAPIGQWIKGQGWNETAWEAPRIPTRADLDAAAPLHPVILWRADLHLAVANSPALDAAGIDEEMPNPPQGVIDRDEHGRPTGVLRELAINLVSDTIPPHDDDEAVAAIKAAAPHLYQLGVTGLHDFRIMGGRDGPAAFRAYQRLQVEGALPLRVWMNLPGERLSEAIALGLRTGLGDDFLRVGHVKLFADGAQGARTAWMMEPYEDTGEGGMPLMPLEEMEAAVRRAHAAGLAVAIHAIGDRATHEVVSLLRRLPAQGPRPAAPHRIEHAQFMQTADIERLGRQRVVASVQPRHLVDDMALMGESVGDRARYAYPFRALADAGVPLAFGSDCPVADPNPLLGIEAAVTRQEPDGTPAGGWYPAQRLEVIEAIEAYTRGPAVASGQDTRFGTIAPFMMADLVVLDEDILAISPGEIHGIQVAMTVLNGRIVHRA